MYNNGMMFLVKLEELNRSKPLVQMVLKTRKSPLHSVRIKTYNFKASFLEDAKQQSFETRSGVGNFMTDLEYCLKVQ